MVAQAEEQLELGTPGAPPLPRSPGTAFVGDWRL